MKKKKHKGPGRPTEIAETTAQVSWNILAKQKKWVEDCAEAEGVSASDFVREYFSRAMGEKKG